MMKKTIFLVIAMVLAVNAGCLFTPRDAEEPGEDTDPWTVPLVPKDVFVNLSSGFHAIANSNFERSLSDEFEFIARPIDWPDFVAWDKADEMAFLDRLKGDYTGERTIQFGDQFGIFTDRMEGVTEAWYEGEYLITLDPGDGSDPDIFAGIARFYLEKGSVGWVMTRWDDLDVSSDEYATATFLRKTFQ
ncbi:MAG: hypothetical protein KAV42_01615 [Candidatus Krumholzibacteria bacterium]|nr:hypothetical protein [Candidatus Krumholzibacteria bacterium]